MYNYRICDYVPEPKPAKTGLVVAAHYYPAWVKGGTSLHRGFDGLHDYPERTPIIGYYDGDNPEYNDWEIKWALEHGINCFVHCWYRRRDNVGSPVRYENLRLAQSLHHGFFRARYRDRMNFAIMFEAQNLWGASDREDMVKNLMPFWLENYFLRENYLKIDNKPVLFVYDYQNQLRDAFSDADEQRRTFDKCREMACRYGFDGMLFAVEYRKDDLSVVEDYCARGYDFSFSYCWNIKNADFGAKEIMDEQMRKMRLRADAIPDWFAPTASAMWDPSPRFATMPQSFNPQSNPLLWKLPPEDFRTLLRRIREMMRSLPEGSIGSRMVMLDNWNEWDEGHYIAPSLEFGFGYLQAVREALTECDNLPDYRLPHELGTDPVNMHWEE